METAGDRVPVRDTIPAVVQAGVTAASSGSGELQFAGLHAILHAMGLHLARCDGTVPLDKDDRHVARAFLQGEKITRDDQVPTDGGQIETLLQKFADTRVAPARKSAKPPTITPERILHEVATYYFCEPEQLMQDDPSGNIAEAKMVFVYLRNKYAGAEATRQLHNRRKSNFDETVAIVATRLEARDERLTGPIEELERKLGDAPKTRRAAPNLSHHAILKAVAEVYSCKQPEALTSGGRGNYYVDEPRMVAKYLCREHLPGQTLEQIGLVFNVNQRSLSTTLKTMRERLLGPNGDRLKASIAKVETKLGLVTESDI